MDDPPTCPHCASRTFHIDAGHTFCANGHDQHRGPAAAIAAAGAKDADGDGDVVADDDDWARRGGKVHRVGRGERIKVRRTVRGREAAEMWGRGMGWVVWRGLWAVGGLVGGRRGDGDEVVGVGEGEGKAMMEDEEEEGAERKRIKQELWGVVRGLWALRLGELVQRWDAERMELLEEADATGTDASTDGDVDGEQEQKEDTRKKATFLRHAPKLIDTVALQYLALLLMRYPVSLSTIYTWVQTETLPYVRVIRHIPPEIRTRLPPEYHLSFDTVSVLQREELQLAVHRNVKHYAANFGTTFPPLNWRPLLLEWIEQLALPLQIYAMVKQLNEVCAFDFTYDTTGERRRAAVSYPEAQLMALLVVATKLLFPFDAAIVKRYPRATTEQGLIRVDWQRWLEAKQWFDAAVREESGAKLRPGQEMEIRDVDIMEMDGEGLDEYMDWYQRMWTSDRVEEGAEGVEKELLGMFPVAEVQARDRVREARHRTAAEKSFREQRLGMVLGGLRSRQVITEEQVEEREARPDSVAQIVLRPGMGYQVFQGVDDLEGVAKLFHEEAANAACLEVKSLVRAVILVETRIDKWRRERKRGEFFDEDQAMDLDPANEAELVDVMHD